MSDQLDDLYLAEDEDANSIPQLHPTERMLLSNILNESISAPTISTTPAYNPTCATSAGTDKHLHLLFNHYIRENKSQEAERQKLQKAVNATKEVASESKITAALLTVSVDENNISLDTTSDNLNNDESLEVSGYESRGSEDSMFRFETRDDPYNKDHSNVERTHPTTRCNSNENILYNKGGYEYPVLPEISSTSSLHREPVKLPTYASLEELSWRFNVPAETINPNKSIEYCPRPDSFEELTTSLESALSTLQNYHLLHPLTSQIVANCNEQQQKQQQEESTSVHKKQGHVTEVQIQRGLETVDSIRSALQQLMRYKHSCLIAEARQKNTSDLDMELESYDALHRHLVVSQSVEKLSRITNAWGMKVDDLLLKPAKHLQFPIAASFNENENNGEISIDVDLDMDEEKRKTAAETLVNMEFHSNSQSVTISSAFSKSNLPSKETSAFDTIVVSSKKYASPKFSKKKSPATTPIKRKQVATAKKVKKVVMKSSKLAKTNPEDKCSQCSSRDTPEWRRGPSGPRTLCNACGLFFGKLIAKYGDEDLAKEVMRKRKEGGKCLDRRVPIDI